MLWIEFGSAVVYDVLLHLFIRAPLLRAPLLLSHTCEIKATRTCESVCIEVLVNVCDTAASTPYVFCSWSLLSKVRS